MVLVLVGRVSGNQEENRIALEEPALLHGPTYGLEMLVRAPFGEACAACNVADGKFAVDKGPMTAAPLRQGGFRSLRSLLWPGRHQFRSALKTKLARAIRVQVAQGRLGIRNCSPHQIQSTRFRPLRTNAAPRSSASYSLSTADLKSPAVQRRASPSVLSRSPP